MIAARQVAFGKAAGGKLPDGVIPVEYLESTGTQYILFEDIGINGLDGWMLPERTRASVSGCVGVWNGGAQSNSVKYQYLNDRGWVVSGSSQSTITGDIDLSFKHVTVRDVIATVGENSYTLSVSWDNYLSNHPFALFGSYKTSDSTVTLSSCQIGLCKLYNNDTLVRDLIPVLDKAGVACMYDEVSGEFFYNQGTGEFIAGPEITEE